MSSSDPNESDFRVVEKCLENDAAALALLRTTYREPVAAYLLKAGATGPEAEETVEMLWADLLTPTAGGHIRLRHYDGSCALLTWLNTVAMNALLSRKKSDGRRDRRFVSSDAGDRVDAAAETGTTEAPLVDLIHDAVEFAFRKCAAEDFVLLQLEHCDQLERDELARMFRCSRATVSRMLANARLSLAEITMDYVRRRDPWLELQWEDFLELCRTATLSCFVFEE